MAPLQIDRLVGSRTFAEHYARDANSLNALRMFFALLVIASHSYGIVFGEKAAFIEPLAAYSRRRIDMGALAVDGFFAISGFLLTASYLHGRGFLNFLARRGLRIYPGFIVCIAVCIGVVGPLGRADKSNLAHYFGDPATYGLVKYLCFGSFHNWLPGAFLSNPQPQIANSSLWTIKYEIFCYVILALLGVWRLLRPKVILCAFVSCFVAYNVLSFLHIEARFALSPGYMPRFLTFFFAGSTLYLYRERIRSSGALFCTFAVIVAGSLPFIPTITLPVLGVYCLFYTACLRLPRVNAFGTRNDLSYGVYLYAWPISQLLLFYGVGAGRPLLLTIATIPLVLAAAGASWFFVERQALSLKDRTLKAKTMKDVTRQNAKIDGTKLGVEAVLP